MICEAKENYAPTGKNTLTFGLLDFFFKLVPYPNLPTLREPGFRVGWVVVKNYSFIYT